MTCTEVMAEMHRYIDREMRLAQLEHIDRHLAGCWNCRQEVQIARGLRQLLRRTCSERAPEALRVRITARIAEMRQAAASTPGC
jgi:mycothiol system anti-sigma-R factor